MSATAPPTAGAGPFIPWIIIISALGDRDHSILDLHNESIHLVIDRSSALSQKERSRIGIHGGGCRSQSQVLGLIRLSTFCSCPSILLGSVGRRPVVRMVRSECGPTYGPSKTVRFPRTASFVRRPESVQVSSSSTVETETAAPAAATAGWMDWITAYTA